MLTAEYPDFFLVNVYVPNSKRELERLPYRQLWDADFLKFLKRLERKKPVIFCGDLNVAHTENDLANPKANVRNHGFTLEERNGFTRFIRAGFVDTFREFEPGGGHYSWWSQMSGARARNIGWRIDYVLLSRSLRPRLKQPSSAPKSWAATIARWASNWRDHSQSSTLRRRSHAWPSSLKVFALRTRSARGNTMRSSLSKCSRHAAMAPSKIRFASFTVFACRALASASSICRCSW